MSDKQKYTVMIMTEDGDPTVEVDITTGMGELLSWWIATAADDFDQTVPKIEDYGVGNQKREGSADMRAIGETFAELLGLPEETPSAVKQQIAAWTYLVGKNGRCIANFQQGQLAKADTVFDATVYCMMMRRIAEVGNWPG